MNGEKKEIPKGTLGLVELYCLSIGQVIGAGVITLVGPAITATGYSAWLAYLLAIVLGFFTVFPLVFICGTLRLIISMFTGLAKLTVPMDVTPFPGQAYVHLTICFGLRRF